MFTISKVFIILFPMFSLPVKVGNILAAFKTNQSALLSSDCPTRFFLAKLKGRGRPLFQHLVVK